MHPCWIQVLISIKCVYIYIYIYIYIYRERERERERDSITVAQNVEHGICKAKEWINWWNVDLECIASLWDVCNLFRKILSC